MLSWELAATGPVAVVLVAAGVVVLAGSAAVGECVGLVPECRGPTTINTAAAAITTATAANTLASIRRKVLRWAMSSSFRRLGSLRWPVWDCGPDLLHAQRLKRVARCSVRSVGNW